MDAVPEPPLPPLPPPRELCCRLFVGAVKTVPVTLTLGLLSWSYYAYVSYACCEYLRVPIGLGR